MGYRNFRSFIEKDDTQGMTEFLEKKFLKNDREKSNCKYEDYTILKDLIRHGKKDLIRKCIEKGFPVNIDIEDKSFDGTPLHLAVLLRCPETVQLLLDNGSCIYKNNGNKETPLLLSAISGNDQITDILLSRIEAKEYFSDENISHFHIACIRNHVKLAHQFLMSGTDIHQSVRKVSQFWPGYTPLHLAVEYRSIETVEFLVKNGADITIQNKHGSTPVHLAYRIRDKKIIDILLSAQCFYHQNPTNRVALSHFHIACATNNVAAVKGFIEKELKYDRQNLYEARTYPHNNALSYAINNDCFDVLEYLLTCDDWFLENKPIRIIDDAYAKGSPEVLNLIISCFEKNMVNFQCKFLLENYSSKKKQFSTIVQSNSSNTQEHFERHEISQQTKLHVAVLKKDRSLVTSILKTHHPSIITMKDAREQTPLHLAFETNQTEFQKQIIQKLLHMHLKINDNPADSNGLSHFHIACTTDNVNIIKDFLKKGADVDSVIEMSSPIWAGYTPLHFAIWFEQTEVAKLLLKYGANFAAKNASKLSPFDFAIPDVIKHSHTSPYLDDDSEDDEYSIEDEDDGSDRDDGNDDWELVQVMVSENNDRKVYGFDDRGITPLHLAAMNNDIRQIKYLANAHTVNKRTDLNLPPSYAGLTPLHFAVKYRNRTAATTLLDYGADVAIQNVQKETAAHICEKTWFREKVGRRLLLGSKNVCNEYGVSLFHLACRTENMEAVKHLLKLKIDINESIRSESQNQGKTALHLAVEADGPEIVKILLDHGADVNARDRYFATPIAFCKSKEVFNMLLGSRADLQALNYEYKTALSRVLYNSEDSDFLSAVVTDKRYIDKVVKLPLVVALKLHDSARISLLRYIESRIMLGVELTFQTRHVYDDLRTKTIIKQHPGPTHTKKCTIEIESMKGFEIDSRITLYDVLLKSSSEMARYSKNEALQKIVESGQDLRNRYPVYASTVVLQFNRGRKRTVLIKKGKKSLNVLANRWMMGDLVLETILQFLDDYEIQYLIYATSGRNILDRKF